MTCPLGTNMSECVRSRCGWWVKDSGAKGACAMACIGRSMLLPPITEPVAATTSTVEPNTDGGEYNDEY